MSNSTLEVFDFEGAQIRIHVDGNGEPLFCAKDVAEALGYANTRDAIRKHCKSDGVAFRYPIVDRLGREQKVRFIPEGDVYRLIVHSKLPNAVAFEKKLFEEVVPAIRKHGAYMTEATLEKALTSPDFLIQLATQLKDEQQKRLNLENQMRLDAPKVHFAEAVSTAKTSILIGDLAKILTQNGYETGQKRLFEWLRTNGYLIKQKGSSWNMPTQTAMEKGLFEVKESTHQSPDGSVKISKTTKVTGKGQIFFIDLFTRSQGASC